MREAGELTAELHRSREIALVCLQLGADRHRQYEGHQRDGHHHVDTAPRSDPGAAEVLDMRLRYGHGSRAGSAYGVARPGELSYSSTETAGAFTVTMLEYVG